MFLGEDNVGKTELTNRIITREFKWDSFPTLGIDLFSG